MITESMPCQPHHIHHIVNIRLLIIIHHHHQQQCNDHQQLRWHLTIIQYNHHHPHQPCFLYNRLHHHHYQHRNVHALLYPPNEQHRIEQHNVHFVKEETSISKTWKREQRRWRIGQRKWSNCGEKIGIFEIQWLL